MQTTRLTLHVPMQRNNGDDVTDAEYVAIERDILEWAEGFTATDSVGVWRGSDGTIYRDPVRVYTIDVPASRSRIERLTSLGEFVATALDQEAVYTTVSPIVQRLIEPSGVLR